MRRKAIFSALAVVVIAALPAPAIAAPRSDIAALQVALRAHHVYSGDVDGIRGSATVRAVKRLQSRAGLVADGIVGSKTRPYLGRLGAPALGNRVLHLGLVGQDVAELQFLLAEHGFPCAHFDGRLGRRTLAALRRFQHFSGLVVDGRAGASTLAALAAPPPQAPASSLDWPLRASLSDGFGPRGDRFHAGIDLRAASGTPVAAAGNGEVALAEPYDGYGLLVAIAHGKGLRSYYGHLSRIDVHVGETVAAGQQIGLVGATGSATGPHLHFELRLRGAAVDPLPALR